jgi:PTS system nitrogen regulatory IIA component
MRLSSFTDARLIDLALDPGPKEDVLSLMVDLLAGSPAVKDKSVFLKDVLSREKLVTTGVGYGVAFPHAKSEAIGKVVFAFGRTKEGVDFDALDGMPVRLVFLIGAPKEQDPPRVYLNLMARLSFLMKDERNREKLLSTESAAEVLDLLDSVK